MTSKEIVLAEYPEATCIEWRGPHGLDNKTFYIYPDGLIFKAISRGWSSEEAAWQNAAESLPAQPEQHEFIATVLHRTDLMPWTTCDKCGKTSSDLIHAVAPVEAKEKEYRYQLYLIHSGEVVGTYCQLEPAEDARHNAQMEPKYYAIRDLAEPKPTPSAPATESSDFDLRKQTLWEAAGIAETMWREDDNRWNRCVSQYRNNIQQLVNAQPQPDSSSISSEQAAMRSREEWRRCALDAEASLESTKVLHASIIDQGRKVLNATSDIGMSHAEYIEWVMKELEVNR